MFARSFRFAAGALYDNLLSVFILGVIWFLFNGPVLLIYAWLDRQHPAGLESVPVLFTGAFAFKFLLVYCWLWLNPFTFAAAYICRDFAKREKTGVKQFFKYAVSSIGISLKTLLTSMAASAVLIVDLAVYGKIFSSSRPFFLIAAALTAALAFLLMFCIANLPFLHVIEPKKVFASWKRAFRYAVLSPSIQIFTLWFSAACLFFANSLISIPFYIFMFPMVISQFHYEGILTTREKMGVERGAPEETRSFKDYLFPWRTSRKN